MASTTAEQDSMDALYGQSAAANKPPSEMFQDNEKPPPFPPRPASMSNETPQGTPKIQYKRDEENVMAYMVALPRPTRDGVPQDVPQRYLLYIPKKPDLLKQIHGKEKVSDKAVRLWQKEVRRAKTYNGSPVSLRGIESVSIRGALWALNLIRPPDVTFLSRIPRKTIRSLELIHGQEEPEGSQGEEAHEEDLFDGVTEELRRSKKRARRNFWIGTALLPVTTTVDLVIPVFGGLSEVNLVWMAINASGWVTGHKIIQRLVLPSPPPDDIYAAEDEEEECTEEKATSSPRKRDKSIKVVFLPCPEMDIMAQYIQEACHQHNPEAFPAPAYTPGDVEVLTSIGWAPEHRAREDIDQEEDMAVSHPTPMLFVCANYY